MAINHTNVWGAQHFTDDAYSIIHSAIEFMRNHQTNESIVFVL